MVKRRHGEDKISIDVDHVNGNASLPEPEVIDLANESPPPTSGTDSWIYLHFMHIPFMSTLCASGNPAQESSIIDVATDSPTAEQQRWNIMAHAASVNNKRAKTTGGGASSSDKQTDSEATRTGSLSIAHQHDDEDAAKQAIMQHAAQLAPSNSLLAQLHAERLARQQLAHPHHKDHDSAQQDVPKPAAPEPVPELSLLTYNVWYVC